MSKRRKKDNLLGGVRLKRRVISVTTLTDVGDDREFWARQTPQARMRALELMRRINYGSAATGRLQRFFEVVHPKAR